MVISILAQNKVALDRTQAYLSAPEVEESDPNVYAHNSEKQGKLSLRLKNVTFRWQKAAKDTSGHVPKGIIFYFYFF